MRGLVGGPQAGFMVSYADRHGGRAAWHPNDGAGGHWWRQLVAADCVANQLRDPVGVYRKPAGW
jgi:hypothetical protein